MQSSQSRIDGGSREVPIPRFFFDHCDEHGYDRDDSGLELPDFETAYLEAHQAATEMWIEALQERRNPSRERFEIRDAHDEVLLVLPFSEIAEPAQRARPPPASLAVIQKSQDRALDLQAEVRDQIKLTYRRLRETKETLERLDAITGVRGGR